ncbi:hypothetical protein BKA56DRAFT_579625 [Ilyonectria sp. MPI-CAGE-AT-0026]|nr:hypothetical protein BKA56DRAFT_579625 [Ilyonectria sp. MPI-CAGE-AT-0026]
MISRGGNEMKPMNRVESPHPTDPRAWGREATPKRKVVQRRRAKKARPWGPNLHRARKQRPAPGVVLLRTYYVSSCHGGAPQASERNGETAPGAGVGRRRRRRRRRVSWKPSRGLHGALGHAPIVGWGRRRAPLPTARGLHEGPAAGASIDMTDLLPTCRMRMLETPLTWVPRTMMDGFCLVYVCHQGASRSIRQPPPRSISQSRPTHPARPKHPTHDSIPPLRTQTTTTRPRP